MYSLRFRVLFAALSVSSSISQGVVGSGKEDNEQNSAKNDHKYGTSSCRAKGVNDESICTAIDGEEFGDSEDLEDIEVGKPDLWAQYLEENNCGIYPLNYSEEFWFEIREKYLSYDDEGFDHYIHANRNKNGFYVPYRVQFQEDFDGQSYGIFSKEFIPKGTLVYRASIQNAKFDTFDSFAQFLDEIIFEKSIRCNLLSLAYRHKSRDPVYLFLDDGSFMKTSPDIKKNIGLLCPHEDCINNDSYYALKDIDQNEEIIFDFPPDYSLVENSHFMEWIFYQNLSFQRKSIQQKFLHPITRIHWWIYNPAIKLHHVREVFDCENIIYSTQRPIHEDIIWRTLRQHYYQLQQQKYGRYDEKVFVPSSSSLTHESGFQVPYEVRYIEGRGRCVFATKFIPKGTFVYSDEPFMAKFTTKLDFLRFLATLPFDNDMICDVIEWSYAANLSDYYGFPDDQDPDLAIIFGMDEGSLVNDAGDPIWEENLDEEPNIGCPHKKEGKRTKDCVTQLYALNDIQPGEEITCNYHDFARPYYWRAFDL